MRKVGPNSVVESRLVGVIFVGLASLGFGIAGQLWWLAALGFAVVAGGGWLSIRMLDRGSTPRKLGWLGAQLASFVIGGGIALASGLSGRWLLVPIIPAMAVGWWVGNRILNGPRTAAGWVRDVPQVRLEPRDQEGEADV